MEISNEILNSFFISDLSGNILFYPFLNPLIIDFFPLISPCRICRSQIGL